MLKEPIAMVFWRNDLDLFCRINQKPPHQYVRAYGLRRFRVARSKNLHLLLSKSTAQMALKRIIWAFFPLLILAAQLLAAGCVNSPVVSLKAIVGKEIVIKIEANHTTGYSWELAEPLDKRFLKFIETRYETGNMGRAGAPGVEIWTFKALKVGETKIKLKYVRPWEKGIPPVKICIFDVTIGPEQAGL